LLLLLSTGTCTSTCTHSCRIRAKDYRDRSLTAILYLNDADWDGAPEADGGCLTCFVGADADDVVGGSARRIERVNPAGGTLVLFDSRYLLHAVQPSRRDRMALTLWVVGRKGEVSDTASSSSSSGSGSSGYSSDSSSPVGTTTSTTCNSAGSGSEKNVRTVGYGIEQEGGEEEQKPTN
jgi:hypothetical protein